MRGKKFVYQGFRRYFKPARLNLNGRIKKLLLRVDGSNSILKFRVHNIKPISISGGVRIDTKAFDHLAHSLPWMPTRIYWSRDSKAKPFVELGETW